MVERSSPNSSRMQTRSQRRASRYFATSTADATEPPSGKAIGRKRKLQVTNEELKSGSISVQVEQIKAKGWEINTVELKAERVASPERAVAASTTGPKSLAKPREEPPRWREHFNLLVELRQERIAPVDSMEPELLGDEGPNFEFQILVALMLSSQTRDQLVYEAIQRLKEHTLSVESIAKMENDKLQGLISKVSFYNNKTKFIKKSVEIIQEKYEGKVPDTLEGLLELPGVGPKMALLVLLMAFGKKDAGIAIDSHMHRICNQLGWVSSKTADQTRVQLESWLPTDKWHQINPLMVGMGQMIQQPKYRARMLSMIDTWPQARQKEAFALLKKLGLKIPRKAEKK
mmetsp:Transcript_18700/g.34642  ORF Transcript_18700/g.34642 Transcript_18700/m.34642 type:complete len:345 (+) Transcript_18700:399-1433(+)